MEKRSQFVHLHTHSHYSLLDGLAKIDDLLARTKELGMDTLALTDHGVLYGAVEFYKKAKKAGIKPILGVEAYIAPQSRLVKDPGERYFHMILLAENTRGWKNLIQIVSRAHLEGFYYKPRADKELLREYHAGLIALSGCIGGEINRLLLSGRREEALRTAREYQDIFGPDNFFLEVGDHPNIPEAVKLRTAVIDFARETRIPLVATQDIHYAAPTDAEFHDVLLAVQTASRLSDDDRLSLKADDFSMTSPEQMQKKFQDVPEAITNTVAIGARCDVDLELGKILLPDFPKPANISANDYLRRLVEKRFSTRFAPPEVSTEIRERLEYELGVITKTGFADYFLIVQDLINWAKSHGIAVGPGRGSAAGSLVSYILGITDVNPLTYDLLFERFLNPERVQMPDIDIDFADTRRDEVLSYARQKYGEDRVAQIITFGTMAARAAVRDTGRAMGIEYGFCDMLAKLIPFNMHIVEAIEKVPELKTLYIKDPRANKLLEIARHLEGVARHASVHACGTVISKEALTEYLPLQLAPQDKNNIITQLEMHSVEDLGLLKIDFLGLRNLTIIENTLRLVKEMNGKSITISAVPLNDAETFKLLRTGDTTGVFQFESSGMRRYMKDMRPTELEDLIALVALYRPGPLEMGMVPKYIARKNKQEPVTYLHPKLEPILKTTYGIGVYQEQMMRIARDLAGYTLPEADILRKAIGKKIKSLLDEQKDKLIQGMIKNDIDAKTAQAIWELFPPFARYGFNKSHAVCYALIGYWTAYLKAHYPEEFMASLLNAESQYIDRIAFLISEARQTGLEVLPPDVNRSFVAFTPERENIRFGLLAIKNVGGEVAKSIVEERSRGGAFRDLTDFLNRIQHKDLNRKSLESLIKSGALSSFGIERNQLLTNLDDIVRFNTLVKRDGQRNQNSLFGAVASITALKLKPAEPAESRQKLAWEKELIGFYLSDHPLNSLKEKIASIKTPPIGEICTVRDESRTVKIIGLVSKIQKITTKTGQPMLFATLEDFSPRHMEVVVFNSTLNKTSLVWQENNVVIVQGHMSWRNNEPKMICDRAQILEA